MGHQHQAVHAQATGIAAEEAYVDAHAAAVDRTINSREFKLGTLSYVDTGHVPSDKFWSKLTKQEEKNPSAFDKHNPFYVGFFAAPARLGELPAGNVIFDVMKDRDQTQPAVFAAHHPFYVGLVNNDLALEHLATGTPGSTSTAGGSTTGTTTGGTSGSTAGQGLGGSTTGGTPGSSSSGGGGGGGGSVGPNAVPEPASGLLVGLGVVAAMLAGRAFGRKGRGI